MPFINIPIAVGYEGRTWRILLRKVVWWGLRVELMTDYCGGGSTVLTVGPLWVEWRMGGRR